MTKTPAPARTCTRCRHHAATTGNLCTVCIRSRFSTWADETKYGTKDYRPLRADIREMEADTGTKHCGACERFRDPSKFGTDKRNKDGLTSWCKSCRSTRETRRQAAAREAAKTRAVEADVDAYITDTLAEAFDQMPATAGDQPAAEAGQDQTSQDSPVLDAATILDLAGASQ